MHGVVTELLSPEVWRAIEDRGHSVEFARGDALMHQGSTGRSCFAIVSGTALVTATSTHGATWVSDGGFVDRSWENSLQLLQHLAGRIRSLSERFALRSEDLEHRLLEVLTTNLEERGDPVFRSTREELAGWVGAMREAVVRSLHRMKADGIVDLGRGTVRLLACAG